MSFSGVTSAASAPTDSHSAFMPSAKSTGVPITIFRSASFSSFFASTSIFLPISFAWTSTSLPTSLALSLSALLQPTARRATESETNIEMRTANFIEPTLPRSFLVHEVEQVAAPQLRTIDFFEDLLEARVVIGVLDRGPQRHQIAIGMLVQRLLDQLLLLLLGER